MKSLTRKTHFKRVAILSSLANLIAVAVRQANEQFPILPSKQVRLPHSFFVSALQRCEIDFASACEELSSYYKKIKLNVRITPDYSESPPRAFIEYPNCYVAAYKDLEKWHTVHFRVQQYPLRRESSDSPVTENVLQQLRAAFPFLKDKAIFLFNPNTREDCVYAKTVFGIDISAQKE